MSTEIRTPSREEIAKFVLDHADQLKDKAIEIRQKDKDFLAELFSTKEPAS